MPGTKHHFKFNATADESVGWGENWYLAAAASSDLQAEINAAAAYVAVRKELLGPGYWLQAVTVSDMDDVRRYREIAYDKMSGASSLFAATAEGEFVEAALMASKTNLSGKAHGRVFLRGLPGNEIGPGGAEGLGPVWNGAYAAYKAEVVGRPWCFLGRLAKTKDRQAGVVTVTQNADRTMSIVLFNTPLTPLLVDGTKYKVQLSGVFGLPFLNGTYVVQFKAPLTLTTTKQILLPPGGGGSGTVTFLDQNPIPVAYFINERIVGRKAGKAFFALRGRAKGHRH